MLPAQQCPLISGQPAQSSCSDRCVQMYGLSTLASLAVLGVCVPPLGIGQPNATIAPVPA